MNQVNNDWLYSSDAFQAFFKNSSRSLLLKANPPYFTILAISEAYLTILHKERFEVINQPFLEVYIGTQTNSSLKEDAYGSFMRVITTKETDVPPAFTLELFIGDTGKYQTEHWSNLNEPLIDEKGDVAYIITSTVNITEHVNSQQVKGEAVFHKQAFESEHVLNEALALTNKALLAKNEELSRTGKVLLKTNENLEDSIVKRSHAFHESETRFKTIVEQAPVAIATFKGPEFIIELFNDKILEYWGRTAEQVKRVPLFTTLPEISGQGLEELLTHVLTTGEHLTANEFPVNILRNGKLSAAWFNFIYDPLKDESGIITGIISVCNEVTEQVNARKNLEKIIEEKTLLETTLRESEQRLQGILDTMAEGVGIIDTTGKLVYANKMAQRILGLKENEIKEYTYNDPKWQNLRVDGSILPEEEHPMTIMMSTKNAVYDYEIGIKPPEKDVLYISINAAPIINGEGKLTGGIGTFMDVTNRRKLLEQKDEFISVASHELKTPLTALKASIQILNSLKEDLSSPYINPLIIQADSSVNRLNTLVNDLLDVNRISRGKLLLRKTKFSLSDMINDCCHHIVTAGTHEVSFQGSIDKNICADEQRIKQVMINFVTNAVKYAPKSNRITITVEALEDKVKVSVTDFGLGIPKERMPKLFDRYYRADYNIGQGGGLGLGLYISSEIIKNHGGDIGAESEHSKGSTFWFTLPVIDECK